MHKPENSYESDPSTGESLRINKYTPFSERMGPRFETYEEELEQLRQDAESKHRRILREHEDRRQELLRRNNMREDELRKKNRELTRRFNAGEDIPGVIAIEVLEAHYAPHHWRKRKKERLRQEFAKECENQGYMASGIYERGVDENPSSYYEFIEVIPGKLSGVSYTTQGPANKEGGHEKGSQVSHTLVTALDGRKWWDHSVVDGLGAIGVIGSNPS